MTLPSDPQPTTVRALDDHRRPRATSARRAGVDDTRAPARVVLYHPALLAGRATAAALDGSADIAGVVVVGSATELVRETSLGSDVALVSETLGQDLPEVLQALAFRGVAVPVVVMTTATDPELAAQYLEWGAAGSVDVRGPVSTLVRAVALASTGAPVVEERFRAEVAHRLDDRAAHREHARRVLQGLSPRERQVIESLAQGTGVAEIARGLHLSPHTIRACVRTLGPKLGVAGQLQIASVARELLRVAQQPTASRYLQRVRSGGFGPMQLSS